MAARFQFPFLFGFPLLPARRVIGIDPGARCVRFVLLEEFLGRLRILRQEILEVRTDTPASRQDLESGLLATLEDLGDYPVALAMPQNVTLSQIIDLPSADPATVKHQIGLETQKLGGLSESALVYDYCRLNPFPPHRNPFWITLCQESEILAMLTRLGLTRENLCEVTTTGNARMAALRTIDPALTHALIADVGATATSVTLVVEGQSVLATSFPVGGDTFTEAVAAGHRCSFDAAEELKHAEPMLGGDNDSAPLRHAIDDWRLELERLLDEWLAEHPGSQLQRDAFLVVLSGGGAALPGLLEHLHRTPGLRFAYWPAGRRTTAALTGESAVAFGAALQALGHSPQPASLLPDDLRRTWKSLRSTQLFQSLSVFLLIVVTVILGAATWQQSQIYSRKQEILHQGEAALETAKRTAAILARLDTDFEKLRPILERQRHTHDTLQTLRLLRQSATNRPIWFVLFGDEQSYLQAPLASNAAPAALAGDLPPPAATNLPPSRRAFVAELAIAADGDAMRNTLSDVVTELKSLPLFYNVDTLPADLRRAVVDPRAVLAERHFALALELKTNEFARPPAPAERPARPGSTPTPTTPSPYGPLPPSRFGPDPARDAAANF